jgi:hypothetical protein
VLLKGPCIQDFRLINTGLYSNLARLDLTYAEAVFNLSYFRQNPVLEFAVVLIIGVAIFADNRLEGTMELCNSRVFKRFFFEILMLLFSLFIF